MNHSLIIRRLLAILTAAALVQCASAQASSSQPASEIKTQVVTLISSGQFDCYLATPTGEGPFPGVLLLHDRWGLNDWLRQQAERFARQGYAALALDLYHGKTPADAGQAAKMIAGLSEQSAYDDARFGLEFLAGGKLCRGKKTVAVGWGKGGTLALLLAARHPSLGAAVACCPQPIQETGQFQMIKGPLLCIWPGGEHDTRVDDFKAAIEKAGPKSARHSVYPKVKAGFMDPNNKGAYEAGASKRAWTEIEKFCQTEVKGK